jgi:hypothetical protein
MKQAMLTLIRDHPTSPLVPNAYLLFADVMFEPGRSNVSPSCSTRVPNEPVIMCQGEVVTVDVVARLRPVMTLKAYGGCRLRARTRRACPIRSLLAPCQGRR